MIKLELDEFKARCLAEACLRFQNHLYDKYKKAEKKNTKKKYTEHFRSKK